MSLRRLQGGKSVSPLPLQSCLSQLHGWYPAYEEEKKRLLSIFTSYFIYFPDFILHLHDPAMAAWIFQGHRGTKTFPYFSVACFAKERRLYSAVHVK